MKQIVIQVPDWVDEKRLLKEIQKVIENPNFELIAIPKKELENFLRMLEEIYEKIIISEKGEEEITEEEKEEILRLLKDVRGNKT